MAKVFVSYSRKDIEFAKRLTAELQQSELDFWIDWEGIPPTVDWWREIEKGIEEADVFLFLISPDSAKSKVCGREIDTAIKNGKRIIPIVVRDIKGDETPSQLSHLNWIFFRESDDFDAGLKKLLTGIHTDYEWVKEHRWLQVRALDWQRENKDSGALLRGKDLLDAETNLARNTSKEPHPTDLQREYVLQSRKATDRQRRLLTSISIAGVIALAALAVFGFYQAGQATNNFHTSQTAQVNADNNAASALSSEATAIANKQEAEMQARISRAGELAALAILEKDKHFDLSLLLGIESLNTFENSRTRGTLFTLSDSHPQLKNYLFGHAASVNSLSFSPNGRQLASVGSDHAIILWDIASPMAPSKLAVLKRHSDSVTGVAFSPNGKQLASSSADNSIVLWDISNPAVPTEIATFPGQASNLIFSRDGKYLMSGNTIWDIRNIRKTIKLIEIPYYVYAFSPNGLQVATEEGGDIRIWDISDPEKPSKLGSIPAYSTSPSVAFSFDGKQLVLGGFKASLRLWDISNPEAPQEFPEFPELLDYYSQDTSAVFSPDGKHLVSNKADATIKLWDINNPASPLQIASLFGHTTSLRSLAFSPDGKQFASGSTDGTIILWNTDEWKSPSHLATFAGNDYPLRSLVFSPDGMQLVSATWIPSIILWGIHSTFDPKKLDEIPLELEVSSLAFSSDGNQLLSATDKNFIQWNIARPSPQTASLPISDNGRVLGVLSANGKRLALTSDEAPVTLWDISDVEAPLQLGVLPEASKELGNLVLSPDGNQLAGSVSDYSIVLWNISNLSAPIQLATLAGHNDEISSLAFSRDGKILASASWDNSMILWDITNPTAPLQLATLSGPTHWPAQAGPPFTSIAFSSDNTQLATAGFYGITLWDIDSKSLVEKACQRAGRNFTRSEWAQYFPGDDYPTESKDAACPQWPLEAEITATSTP